MAKGRPGDKQLSAPMMVRLPTHICVARSQWVKKYGFSNYIKEMAIIGPESMTQCHVSNSSLSDISFYDDVVQCPFVIIRSNIIRLGKTHECFLACWCWQAAEDTVRSPANTFLVYNCHPSGFLQKYVHKAQTTQQMLTDHLYFKWIRDNGMAHPEKAHAGVWLGEYSELIHMFICHHREIQRDVVIKQNGAAPVPIGFLLWYTDAYNWYS